MGRCVTHSNTRHRPTPWGGSIFGCNVIAMSLFSRRKGRGGKRGGTRRGRNGGARGDSGDSNVAGLSCHTRGASPAGDSTSVHCVGEGGGRVRRRAGGVDVVMGAGAVSNTSMYRRRRAGLGGRARRGACAAAGMYGPWRRAMPSARVSTRAGGATRLRNRSSYLPS